MATLWRGIIGPDVTIAVLPALHPTALHSATTPASGGGSGGGAAGSSSVASSGVEARLEEARAVLIRGEIGKAGIADWKLRRVGFEVGEWVRRGDDGRRGS